MNVKVFNEEQLNDKDIDEVVTRVKAFIVNDKNEILTASSGGGVQLIGGHVEEGEEMIDSVKREILEETGMELATNDISDPFFEIVYYTKNYKNTAKNRMSDIWYYFISTNQTPDVSKIHLTEQEKERDFQLKWVAMQDFEEYVKPFLDDKKELCRNVANEILIAFEEFKRQKMMRNNNTM